MTIPDQANQCLSPNEAARILGITGEAVKAYIYQHRLPAIKLANGYWRIKKTDLENFIKMRITRSRGESAGVGGR
jgi:excisionase family DNA binding protein